MAQIIRPIKYVFTGDQTAGKSLMKFGANQLSILERQMELGGLRENIRRVSPYTGVKVECLSSFGHQEVRIHVNPQDVLVGEEVTTQEQRFDPEWPKDPPLTKNYFIAGLWRRTPLFYGAFDDATYPFDGSVINGVFRWKHRVENNWRSADAGDRGNLPDYTQYSYTQSLHSTSAIPLGATLCQISKESVEAVENVQMDNEADRNPIDIQTQGDLNFFQIKYLPEEVIYEDADSEEISKQVVFMISVGTGARQGAIHAWNDNQVMHNIVITTSEMLDSGEDNVVSSDPEDFIGMPGFSSKVARVQSNSFTGYMVDEKLRKWKVSKTNINIFVPERDYRSTNISVNFNEDKSKVYVVWSGDIWEIGDAEWATPSQKFMHFDHVKREVVIESRTAFSTVTHAHWTDAVKYLVINREISTTGEISWSVPAVSSEWQQTGVRCQWPFVDRDGQIYGWIKRVDTTVAFPDLDERWINHDAPTGAGSTSIECYKLGIEDGVLSPTLKTCVGNTVINGEFAPYWITFNPPPLLDLSWACDTIMHYEHTDFDGITSEQPYPPLDPDYVYPCRREEPDGYVDSSDDDRGRVWDTHAGSYSLSYTTGSAPLSVSCTLGESVMLSTTISTKVSHSEIFERYSKGDEKGADSIGGTSDSVAASSECQYRDTTFLCGGGGITAIINEWNGSCSLSGSSFDAFGTYGTESSFMETSWPYYVFAGISRNKLPTVHETRLSYDALYSMGVYNGAAFAAWYGYTMTEPFTPQTAPQVKPWEPIGRKYAMSNQYVSNPARLYHRSLHQMFTYSEGLDKEVHSSFVSWDHSGLVIRGVKYCEWVTAPQDEWLSTGDNSVGHQPPNPVCFDFYPRAMKYHPGVDVFDGVYPWSRMPQRYTSPEVFGLENQTRSGLRCKVEVGEIPKVGSRVIYTDITNELYAKAGLNHSTFQYIGLTF